jgi:hypothetical protein
MKRSKFFVPSPPHTTHAILVVTRHRLLKLQKVKKSLPKGGDAVVQGGLDEYPTLVRATYKDTKISTIVSVSVHGSNVVLITMCFV